MRPSEIKAQLEEWRSNKSYKGEETPISLAAAVIDYVNEQHRSNNEFTLKQALIDVGYSRDTNHTSVYKTLCKKTGVVPLQFRAFSNTNYSKAVTTPTKIYLNPEIQRHLDIAKALMEEEETKLAIYYEMKEVMEGRSAS